MTSKWIGYREMKFYDLVKVAVLELQGFLEGAQAGGQTTFVGPLFDAQESARDISEACDDYWASLADKPSSEREVEKANRVVQ